MKLVDSRTLLKSVVEAMDAGKNKHDIAAAALDVLAKTFAEQACGLARDAGVSTVGFSGGVAVNAAICAAIEKVVGENKLKFVTNHKLP
jgi:hydrogenase maturation protein HypF